jgi:hypothetical protein
VRICSSSVLSLLLFVNLHPPMFVLSFSFPLLGARAKKKVKSSHAKQKVKQKTSVRPSPSPPLSMSPSPKRTRSSDSEANHFFGANHHLLCGPVIFRQVESQCTFPSITLRAAKKRNGQGGKRKSYLISSRNLKTFRDSLCLITNAMNLVLLFSSFFFGRKRDACMYVYVCVCVCTPGVRDGGERQAADREAVNKLLSWVGRWLVGYVTVWSQLG